MVTAPDIRRLLTTDCILVMRTQGVDVDEYGDLEWVNDEFPSRCHLQQSSSSEEEGRVQQISLWRLFLMPEAPLSGWDEVRIGGKVYTLEGDAWPVQAARGGGVHHVEAFVRRVR